MEIIVKKKKKKIRLHPQIPQLQNHDSSLKMIIHDNRCKYINTNSNPQQSEKFKYSNSLIFRYIVHHYTQEGIQDKLQKEDIYLRTREGQNFFLVWMDCCTRRKYKDADQLDDLAILGCDIPIKRRAGFSSLIYIYIIHCQ